MFNFLLGKMRKSESLLVRFYVRFRSQKKDPASTHIVTKTKIPTTVGGKLEEPAICCGVGVGVVEVAAGAGLPVVGG